MQVYFAGTIMGERTHVATFRRIVAHIQSRGHTVPTVHVTRDNVLDEEAANTPQQVYERDVAWIRASDCLVAEVSTPSLGVGYEICYALTHGKPVLCLYQQGRPLSKMILGCTEPGITVRAYADEAEALALVDEFLSRQSASGEQPSATDG
ncbi:MAG: nucleoside 2-deoxyribosyltransferase [Anaerolineales bacterium]